MLELVDRAYVLVDGQILFEGKPDALVGDEVVRKLYLGQTGSSDGNHYG
jgi:lipopolysaccharide export system ATP-binding protein